MDLKGFVRSMDRDGLCVFESLFPKPTLRRIRDVVLRRHHSGELKRNGLIRDIGGRYAAVLPFEGPFLEKAFYANPKLHAVLGALLGDYCLSSLEVVISLPGSSDQHQHIDGPIRFDRRFRGKKAPYQGDLSKLPPYALGLGTPLCDVDEENGPTAIWLGSHKEALRPKPPSQKEIDRRYEAAYMTGKFGRSYLFDYRVYHGGLGNMSREPRPLLMLVFTRPWFRDPNLNEVQPSLVLSGKNLARIPESKRDLFMLAPAARRKLWSSRST